MGKYLRIYQTESSAENGSDEIGILPVRGFVMPGYRDFSAEDILRITDHSAGEIGFLCDGIFFDGDLEKVTSFLHRFGKDRYILFQDFGFFMVAEKMGLTDKLIYFSPTLCVSAREAEAIAESGIRNIVLSPGITETEILTCLKKKSCRIGIYVSGNPLLYFSRRKLVSSYEEQYSLEIRRHNLRIKEQTRPAFFPLAENGIGTAVYAEKPIDRSGQISEYEALGADYYLSFPETER